MSRYNAVLLVVFAGIISNIADANEAPAALSKLPAARRTNVVVAECYSCVSCPQITNTTTIQTCPYNANTAKLQKCIKYSEKYPEPFNGNNISWVIRGCVSEKGTCEELKAAYRKNPDLQLGFCTECEGDRCNGVSRSVSDFFFAFFAVVLVPILGKFILS